MTLNISDNYFSSFSRDALRILQFMASRYPKQKLFLTSDFREIVDTEGQSLGGILGSFSKRSDNPLVKKIGYVSTGWDGKPLSRPEQVWTLSPKLTGEQISDIRNILTHFMLDELT